MTTLLLTGYNDHFAPLGDLTAPVMLSYAGKCGYDFKCFRHPGSAIEATWHKIQATLDGLAHYDRVLWIDADILITNDTIRHEYDSGLHFSLDWGRDATERRHFSAGCYLICRNAASMFSEVVAVQEEMMCKGEWEQEPLRANYFRHKKLVTIHNRRVFGSVPSGVHESVVDPWQPGDWAAHFTMVPLEERVRMCKEMLS